MRIGNGVAVVRVRKRRESDDVGFIVRLEAWYKNNEFVEEMGRYKVSWWCGGRIMQLMLCKQTIGCRAFCYPSPGSYGRSTSILLSIEKCGNMEMLLNIEREKRRPKV